MMKKINKTANEILNNEDLRKRAEMYEGTEIAYESQNENNEEADGEVDDEVDDEVEGDEDEYADDDYKDNNEEARLIQSAPDNKKGNSIQKEYNATNKSSSRFSRDPEELVKSNHKSLSMKKEEGDEYDGSFDRESEGKSNRSNHAIKVS